MGWFAVALTFAIGYLLTLWILRRVGSEEE